MKVVIKKIFELIYVEYYTILKSPMTNILLCTRTKEEEEEEEEGRKESYIILEHQVIKPL